MAGEPIDHMKEASRLEKRGDLCGAVAHLEQAVAADKRNWRAWMLMASYLNDMGHHRAALVAAKRAVRCEPNALTLARIAHVFQSLKLWNEARAAFERSLALSPSPSADRLVLLGCLEMQLGHYSDAQRTLSRALEVDGNNAEALYYLARLMEMYADQQSEAIDLLQRSLESDPDSPEAVRELGYLTWRRGDRRAGKKLIETAIEMDRDQPKYQQWAHIYIGNIAIEEGRYVDAARSFRKAGKLNRISPVPYLKLARLCRLTGRKRLAAAMQIRARQLVHRHYWDEERHGSREGDISEGEKVSG